MRGSLAPTVWLLLVACQGSGDKSGNTGTGTVPTGGTPGGVAATPPRAENDLTDVVEAGAVNINLASNDFVGTNPLALGSIVVVDPPQFGVVTTQTNGTVDYTHDGSESDGDNFTYTIADSTGLTSNVATVQVAVASVNDVPVAVDDAAAVDQGELTELDLAGNDSDVDDGLALGSITIVTQPARGTLSLNGDGTVDYDHDGTAFVADGFTYTIADATGATSNVATVALTIATTNVPPIAVDDFDLVAEAGALNLAVLYNDFDIDDALDPSTVVVTSPPTNGTATVLPDGTVDYQHDGSETGADSFLYTVYDTAGSPSNAAVVQLAVVAVNDPPRAFDDAEFVSEDQSINLRVLLNDTDVDSAIDPFSVAIVDAPSAGTVFVNLDGTVDYTHDGTQVFGDSFTYRVSDVEGAASNLATVDLTIGLSNDPPVTVDDVAVVDEGGVVVVPVLANDSDPDDAIAPTTVAIVTGPASGTAVVNPDGTVQYTHDGSEGVADSFAYTVEDTLGNVSAPATVDVAVAPVNDPPVAAGDFYVVAEGSTNNVLNVLANDTDVDDGLDPTSLVIDTAPTNGVANANTDGTVSYTHDGSYTISDSFSYRVLDLSGASSSVVVVNLSVLGNNDPPVAADDAFVVAEGGTAPVAVLANDSDVDDGLDLGTVSVVVPPANGDVIINGAGVISYTHDGSETAGDTFSYLVRDLSGLISNAADVVVTVTPVNDPPTAVADLFTVAEGGSSQLDVQANDSDPDDGIDAGSVVLDTLPAYGTANVVGSGRVAYTHNGSEVGSDTFSYHLSDNAGLPSATVVVVVNVTPVNDAPVALNDSGVVNEGAQVNVPVVANDTDADDGVAVGTVTIVSAPVAGTATPQPNGVVLYQHGGGEAPADSFTYRVKDASGVDSNVATVSITVNPVNDPPVAVPDSFVVSEGSAGNVLTVLSNDSDVDGGLNVASVVLDTPPTRGTATVNADGTVTYDHDGSANPSDSFSYHVSDVSGASSASVVVSLTISAVNDPPVAVNDSGLTVAEGGNAAFAVLGNDTDPDDGINPATVAVVTGPTRGTALVNVNGTVTYTHNGGETTTDSFTYTVRDYAGAVSNIATAAIVITPVNDVPVAANSSETVSEGSSQSFALPASDADDGVNLASIVIVTPPARGSLGAPSGGSVLYTHDGSEAGSDSFTWRVSDVAGATSNVATVSITIAQVNDPPVAGNDTDSLAEGGSKFVNVLANDTDVDNALAPNSIVVVAAPSNGTATPSGGSIQYVHNGSETVSDSFTYRVSDASGAQSNVATVNLTITPVNDPPVAAADGPFSVNEGASRNVVVLSNDSDVDNAIAPATVTVTGAPSNGSATARADGTIDYTHNGSETLGDSFTYRVSDAAGAASNVVAVTMTVTPVNDPPVAVNDSGAAFTVSEGSSASFPVLANDVDPEGSLNPSSLFLASAPLHGSVSVVAGGAFQYTHDGSETLTDSFQYLVSDTAGLSSNVATVSVTISPVNDAPIALSDATSVAFLGGTLVNVVGNDYDVDGTINVATVAIVTAPGKGNVTVNANGTVNYQHTSPIGGFDSFTYTVRDNGGATSNTATVDVSISGMAQPPVAVDDAFAPSVVPGGTMNLSLTDNDYDPDGSLNLGSLVIEVPPMFGTVASFGNGVVEYRHNGGYQYNDLFGYRISDNSGLQSNLAWVDVKIGTSCQGVAYFGPSASIQTYALPPCVPAVDIEVYGSIGAGPDPGYGGYAYGQLAIASPGSSLYVMVGDNVGSGGGGYGYWNPYPLWGGGATDVRVGGDQVANRVIVAGGGGAGGEYYASGRRGGDGGGGVCGSNYCGGGGGQGYGGSGAPGGDLGGAGITNNPHSGGAGGGGYQSGGGGSCQSYTTSYYYPYTGTPTCGGTGTLGFGGAGDTAANPLCYSTYGGTRGGGGGYFGGGGSSAGYCGGGGGGGGSSWTGTLANASMAGGVNGGAGEAFLLWGETRSGLAGRFNVHDGPNWGNNPPVVNCVEACALLYGGASTDYQCSTSGTSIDNLAFVSGYADGGYCTNPVSETFKVDSGSGYNCGGFGCAYSAFTQDNCFMGAYNYCWR